MPYFVLNITLAFDGPDRQEEVSTIARHPLLCDEEPMTICALCREILATPLGSVSLTPAFWWPTGIIMLRHYV